MTTSTKSETAAKKDVTKLQRAIVDGLEDVKAQDIQVFNTEHLSPLFERVIVASGTSNRQTKALAASVRDAVRDAGFAKPRIEGEENGEWIIVDCGQAVVHVMQPTFRQYYNLEELWTPPTLVKSPKAEKPAKPAASKKPARAAAPKAAPAGRKPAAKTPATKKPATKKPASKKPAAKKPAAKAPAVKKPATKVAAKKPVARKPAAKKPAAKPAAKPASKPAAKKPAAKKPAAKKKTA